MSGRQYSSGICLKQLILMLTVPGDILSKRAEKADSEQRFYVTGTSFNKTGTLNCRSINRNNSAIQSNTASISPSKLSGSASYRSYAPSGSIII